MASEEKTYTSTFKAKVALEALAQNKKNLDRLSDEYDVPVSYILTWTAQLEKHAGQVFKTTEAPDITVPGQQEEKEIDLEVLSTDVAHSLQVGVMEEGINTRKVLFWAGLSIVLFLIFVKGLSVMYKSNEQAAQDNASAQNNYYQSAQMKQAALKQLSNFGVVDLDNDVYHIPIDSAINEIAVDGNSK